MFKRIKEFELPECEGELYQQIIQETKEGIEIMLNGLKKAAEKIKEYENIETNSERN